MRCIGTTSIGIRCPIIRENDDLCQITCDSIMEACKNDGIVIKDRDVIALTESIVARAQGNYCTCDDIAKDIKEKFQDNTIGVIFPILSRNRFSICLKGIARGAKKIILMLSYPSDEVGNSLIDIDLVDEKGVNPYSDVLSLEKFRELFGHQTHEFTGVDYIETYKTIIESENCECEIIFANHPKAILDYTDCVLTCDIHTRKRTKRLLSNYEAKIIYGLDEIMNHSINCSGYNLKYGLLGSNKANEEKLKLFPQFGQQLVEDIQLKIKELTGKHVEVMIYGDGAFKDPRGHIWELADPTVSPFYTDGLKGNPNEIKIKYLADSQFKDLNGNELSKAISDSIKQKDKDLKGKMVSEGTTPRRITDLIGSLCDLTSGSGDKGTPIVLVQGYFDNYTD